MSKKLLAAFLPLILTHLINAQTIDFTNLQPEKLLQTPINSNELLTAKSVQINDSFLIKAKDSLILQNQDSVVIANKKAIIAQQMDSIWLKTGQTLVGKITFDKDSNSFLFFKDTFRNIQLMPTEVSKLIVFPKKNEDERLDVLSIENEFYFLESDSKATIKIFANRTFKPILDDGPKHYFVESKYCLFKDNTPYLLNNGKSKDTLLFLMNDCKKVMDNFRMGIYTEDNFIEAIIQYNRCY